jgi:hypothetical protein
MCPLVDSLSSCEIYAVIHLLHPRNMSSVEVHNELCSMVYDQNVTSEGTVRQWCRYSKRDGQADFPEEE